MFFRTIFILKATKVACLVEVGGMCGHVGVVCVQRALGHAKALHDAVYSMLMSQRSVELQHLPEVY